LCLERKVVPIVMILVIYRSAAPVSSPECEVTADWRSRINQTGSRGCHAVITWGSDAQVTRVTRSINP